MTEILTKPLKNRDMDYNQALISQTYKSHVFLARGDFASFEALKKECTEPPGTNVIAFIAEGSDRIKRIHAYAVTHGEYKWLHVIAMSFGPAENDIIATLKLGHK